MLTRSQCRGARCAFGARSHVQCRESLVVQHAHEIAPRHRLISSSSAYV